MLLLAPSASASAQTHTVAYSSQYNNPALHSTAVLVVDQANGGTVVSKNSYLVRPIASITKLMTAMVVLESGLDMQEVIRITDADVDHIHGSRSRLPVGATLTRKTALLLSLMSSDNRAAHTLGRNYPGGVTAFAVAMNRKANALGMYSTFFEEPTGLSQHNTSTARDLAKMVSAANTFKQIRDATTVFEVQVSLGKNRTIATYRNTNALVGNSNWRIGVSKTGYTRAAGRCLVMQAVVNNRPMVIVLLDASGKSKRIGDIRRIRDWIERGNATFG